ncbi:hypothetical protein CRENBAI_021674 [Crenichthys baileyi]|uniref:Uncharacterized protein n=1 Tax=Crenichthys baileyi TaxID=28760 RepID=A0AAV9RCT0_9TELE
MGQHLLRSAGNGHDTCNDIYTQREGDRLAPFHFISTFLDITRLKMSPIRPANIKPWVDSGVEEGMKRGRQEAGSRKRSMACRMMQEAWSVEFVEDHL